MENSVASSTWCIRVMVQVVMLSLCPCPPVPEFGAGTGFVGLLPDKFRVPAPIGYLGLPNAGNR